MNGKSTRIILCLLLLVSSIASDAFCAPNSERGVNISLKTDLSLAELYRNSYAIIIGINRYEKWPSLEYAVNDAKAMEVKLKSLGFETATLIDHNATRSNIMRLLGDALPRKVEKNDRVVIFFAGHGQTEELQDGSQMGYIVPVDADTRDIFSTAISMDQVRVFSRRLKAKHVLYLIDSCYSGLGLSRSGSIPPLERDYLRKITTRKAHQMLTAGSKGEQAKEEGAHGLFTKYVLEALDGQADRDDKGYITFSDLASYVKPKVSRESRNSQTPQYGSIDGEGEFVFVTGKVVGTAVAPSRDDEAMAAESREIQSDKQKLASERKKLEAEMSRLAALRKQQEEKARIAEEMRRLEEEKERMRQEQDRLQTEAVQSFTEKMTGMEFIRIKGGCYRMGDVFGDGEVDEKPVHEVCVDDFYLGKYEVTVGQFKKFVTETGYRTDGEKNAGGVIGCFAYDQDDKEKLWNWRSWANWKTPNKYQENEDSHPVSCVSWNDAKAFADWLTRENGKPYRMPTEAEWEYAARGGTQTRNYWGDGKDDACTYANVGDRTPLPGRSTWNNKHECTDGYAFVAPVGRFQPNAFGLYDIIGNVCEWTQDWYGKNYYSTSPRNNPEGPSSGSDRVYRGGSWDYVAKYCRSAYRLAYDPGDRHNRLGFRLLRTR